MPTKTIQDISEKMRDLDFAMLSTRTDGGQIASRPMSNNRQVDYDGDSYFFSSGNTRTVSDIGNDSSVCLTYYGSSGMLGQRPFMLSVVGKAELVQDKAQFKAHWTPDLDRWFEKGIDTPGIVLIKVHADRIHYWDGEDQGDLVM